MAQAYVYEDDATGWRHIQAGDLPSGTISPLTTKGDVFGFDTADARIPVGADGTVLTADSTQALGVKWAAGAGGGVASVTATDTSIVVGGTAANPTVATGTLDVIASDHPAAADWSNNSHKITSVADPTNSQDAMTKHYADAHYTGSGMAGLWTLIFGSVLGADAATIDTGANGIPATSTHLVVVIMAKSDSTSTVFPFFVRGQFNGSGGTAYESSAFGANVNTLSATQPNGIFGLHTDLGTGQSTTAFAPSTIYVPQYASTTISKSWTGTSHQIGRADAANNFTALISGLWNSTAAINQIAITPSSGTNFKAGSSMHIYGIA